MTAYELFARLSPADTTGVLEWLQENDRPAYKTCAGLLAGRRKLRPVFAERKPRAERNAWMADNLGKPANADLATEILQSWILGAHGKMVCGFLDFLKIPHDGKGLIESLPAQPPADEIDKAVEEIFSTFPPGAVTAYLNLFTSMEMTEWPHLKNLVATDPRLCPNPTNR
ncbi:MAG: hypothetical protein WC076_12750 [Terrimicrobiaceae bacterium]|jgi:hypothetical protein|nr:hypothetical protein [Terrimicrobiaceae bacterium]